MVIFLMLWSISNLHYTLFIGLVPGIGTGENRSAASIYRFSPAETGETDYVYQTSNYSCFLCFLEKTKLLCMILSFADLWPADRSAVFSGDLRSS